MHLFQTQFFHFPETHPVHAPPLGPVNPTLHVHAVMAWLVGPAFELSGQGVHAALPDALLYFPTTQDVQVPPLGPVNPALHKHASIAAPAGAENEFAGQSMHIHISLALSYLPALHSTHVRCRPQSFPAFVHFSQQYVHQIDFWRHEKEGDVQ
jgi:hypothetical protein